ncbi:single-stranded-DNA-specific exonuclease RecJ [Metallibacterium sp.]|uniref:single-stranded-DNA-specific exonuclease RecJ n=1 Tax=Metallibacterium sp. TaxID=2940281 RepID=UPI00261E0EB9|nr:single-stranded-DNA-specific exonuclease RecJ [Metallibacterium sp.]
MATVSRLQQRAVNAAALLPHELHPVLTRVYAARGALDAASIAPRLAALHPPHSFSGMAAAVALLGDVLARDGRILIVGDYDCDGATGIAVGVRGLRLLGARHIDYAVPNRFVHGYGLSPALVATLAQAPDLLITVDNGIAALEGVAAARAHGCRVLVTDHHLPGAVLPAADAILNPNLPGETFASNALAGVGVMFYLLLGLRAALRAQGHYRDSREPDLTPLLDLVALGTVADLVPLDANNRALARAGLARMRGGRSTSGIAALFAVSGRDARSATAGDLGFALAPRINAAGRLDDMRIGIECLLTDDTARAALLAAQLHAINAERRDVQAGMLDEALALADADRAADTWGVCLYQPGWHEGVVGLVAARLKEQLHRPVVAFAPAAGAPGELRGSARSIPGLHIRDVLVDVAAAYPGLLPRFGGHAMAAGLSLRSTDYARFVRAFDAAVRARLDPAALTPVLWTDGELQPGEFSLDLARALRDGGPWGQGFPEPLFEGHFVCLHWRPLSGGHWRLRLQALPHGPELDAVHFQPPGERPPTSMRAAYRLQLDTWQGRERLQLLLQHIESE